MNNRDNQNRNNSNKQPEEAGAYLLSLLGRSASVRHVSCGRTLSRSHRFPQRWPQLAGGLRALRRHVRAGPELRRGSDTLPEGSEVLVRPTSKWILLEGASKEV